MALFICLNVSLNAASILDALDGDAEMKLWRR
jgi:hypothetical protein